jgi:RHS repeat-associated protein
VDQLFADEKVTSLGTAGSNLWALTDHEGSVRDLATYDAQNDTTAIANHRIYDSYGNLKSQTNSAVDCLFGYTGRLFDSATGLQNNLNRWYDPSTGSWISQDPMSFAAGDTNLYRYVGNNSLVNTDTSGLCVDRFLIDVGGFFYGFGMGLKNAAEGFGGLLKTAGEGWGDLAFAAYSGAFDDPWLAANVVGDGFNGVVDNIAQDYLALSEDWSLAFDVAENNVEAWLLQKLSNPESIGELSADVFLLLAPGAEGFLGGEADAKIGQFLSDESGSLKLKLQADADATGAHTTFKRDPATGEIAGHAEWDPQGFPVQRTDVTGKSHGDISTPHTHEYGSPNTPPPRQDLPYRPTIVRPAKPDELPR